MTSPYILEIESGEYRVTPDPKGGFLLRTFSGLRIWSKEPFPTPEKNGNIRLTVQFWKSKSERPGHDIGVVHG